MKKTKIICTISDKTCTKEFIKELFKAGMNIVRINSAHSEIAGAEKILKYVREVSDKIAILIDTKGPEIRINETQPSNGFEISTNEIISISGNTDILCRKGKNSIYKYENKPTETILSTNCKTLFNDVPIGAKILIDDGEISLSVIDKLDNIIICKTDNGGRIIGHKSVNIPGVEIDLPSVSTRDIMFIKWAIKNDLDFIAHSFVRDDKDLFPIKK
jgi:Pyruvate kinase